MKRSIGILFVACLLAATNATAASAIIRYDAGPGPLGTNPATVDGYLTQPGNQFWAHSGATTGTGINDGGTPAWQMVTNPDGFWQITPVTVGDIALGNAIGWRLSTNLRMPNPGHDVNDANIQVSYGDGVNLWRVRFGSENDGDQVVRLFDGTANPTYTLQGLGNSAYHRYELVYDPGSLTADLFVDGVEQISNWGGSAIAENAVRFGDVSGAGGGVVNYNLVQWEAPEPTTAALLALGAVVMWRRVERK